MNIPTEYPLCWPPVSASDHIASSLAIVRAMRSPATTLFDFFDEDGNYVSPYSPAFQMPAFSVNPHTLPDGDELMDSRYDGLPPSWVYYVLSPINGLIKIGLAASRSARFSVLKTGSPVPLVMAASHPGGRDVERALHDAFAPVRFDKEWFLPHKDLASWAVGFA